MGNSTPTPPAPSADTDQAAKDANMSQDPLYVLYGSPDCIYCVKASELLLKKEEHHVKIGTNLLDQVHLCPHQCSL